MAENTTQDQSRYQVLRRYRVENRVSGFNAGLWLASSPEEAIARMMDDACCTDQPSPDWLATEVELVQMIAKAPWEDQGLVEYAGDPEELQEWVEAVRDDYHVALVSTRVQGWGDATAIVRLERDGDPALYYLVTDAALKALDLEETMTDAEILAIVETALDATPAGEDWTPAVDDALTAAGIQTATPPDGSDPYEIVRLADGRMIVLCGDVSNACIIRED